MTDKILSILNPVHLPTVSEWEVISDLLYNRGNNKDALRHADHYFFRLQSRFEELTRGKVIKKPAILTKEMFVAEEPDISENDERFESIWKASQSKVWFEGFEISKHIEQCLFYKSFSFDYACDVLNVDYDNTYITSIASPTVFEFITELDRYNRTAKEKIKINWTENFVKELLK